MQAFSIMWICSWLQLSLKGFAQKKEQTTMTEQKLIFKWNLDSITNADIMNLRLILPCHMGTL